ncbi:MAG: glycosyltransferase family 39 protein [Anaerolineales bacterium]|jgi:hypothetical protein
MNEPTASLLDWIRAELRQPAVKRAIRGFLALVVGLIGLSYLALRGPLSPEGYVLLVIAAGLAVWAARARGQAVPVPPIPVPPEPAQLSSAPKVVRGTVAWGRILRPCAAFLLALVAQAVMDLRPSGYPASTRLAGVLYLLPILVLIWSWRAGDWQVLELREEADPAGSWVLSLPSVLCAWLGAGLSLAAYLAFKGDVFTPTNLTLWILALLLWLVALSPSESGTPRVLRLLKEWAQRLWARLKSLENGVHLSGWTLLVLSGFLLAAFFRLYRLDLVAPEMTSDHAEKLLDVMDVIAGKYSTFFPRNTGREFIEFYLAAFVATTFGTGISFITLKIVTAAAGLATLPYVYLLGKEIADRRVGLVAMVLTGIAYWPNVNSRIGLRFPFLPLFVAPALYYLIRGLRHRRAEDFLWAGIALGLGFNGYSPIRILPFVMLAAVILFSLHRQAKGSRVWAWKGLLAAFVPAFVLGLPLLHYAMNNPFVFWERTLTRIGQSEATYPGNPILLFVQNQINALLMFNWSDGTAWFLGVPGRPALDIVSAALLVLGLFFLLGRYLRHRNWLDLFLLFSIPLLMLPSSLAIAFPIENPAENRTSGVYPIVFVVVAIGAVMLLDTLKGRLSQWSYRFLVLPCAGLLFMGAMVQNYQITFEQYPTQYRLAAQNASEIGALVEAFARSVGDYQDAYVIPYPYWVDTRLVGMYGGDPSRDFALPPASLQTLNPEGQPLLIVFNRNDRDTLKVVSSRFPSGRLQRFASKVPDHDFFYYFVPGSPTQSAGQSAGSASSSP